MRIAAYLVCAATASVCATLLLRGWRRTGGSLLLWSGVCFAGLAVQDLLVFIDLVLLSDGNLFLVRNLVGLTATAVLLCALIWEEHS